MVSWTWLFWYTLFISIGAILFIDSIKFNLYDVADYRYNIQCIFYTSVATNIYIYIFQLRI